MEPPTPEHQVRSRASYYFTFIIVLVIGLVVGLFAVPALRQLTLTSFDAAMGNDARAIGHAAQQHMMSEGENPVAFQIDPATGELKGVLSTYVRHISIGTTVVDGMIENSRGTFALRNPKVEGGKPLRFDLSGRRLD